MFAGISLAAVATFLRWKSKPEEKQEKKNTVKFLTQEGRLVEIDVDKLPVAKRKVSKEELQNWIKK